MMNKRFASLWILFSIINFSISNPLEHEPDFDIPAKRTIELDDFDQIAMSVCASLPLPEGKKLVYPVRRKCPSSDSCDTICKSTEVTDQVYPNWATGSPHCIESLHLYKGRPQLAPSDGSNTVDVNRVGPVIKRYFTCNETGCGPNYCCCRKG